MKMNVREAIEYVSRYSPCPHNSLDMNLGNGKIWAKCEDCGEIVKQERIDKYREESMKFEKAIEIILENIKKG
jgi:hypothetical protein